MSTFLSRLLIQQIPPIWVSNNQFSQFGSPTNLFNQAVWQILLKAICCAQAEDENIKHKFLAKGHVEFTLLS